MNASLILECLAGGLIGAFIKTAGDVDLLCGDFNDIPSLQCFLKSGTVGEKSSVFSNFDIQTPIILGGGRGVRSAL